jgi:formate C-acetyltransferase
MEKMAAMEGKVFGDHAKKYTFYRAVVIVCDAYILLAKRYADFCREKAKASTEPQKRELLKIADSLDWISENPARTYWEALEIIILYQMILIADAQQHGLSFGRMDQYTGDLLQAQLDAGTISWDEAQELTDTFILKIADHVNLDRFLPNKRAVATEGLHLMSHTLGTTGQHLTVGGVKKDGTDATNAATLMFLQTYGRLYIPDPSISCRIHKNTPDSVWRHAIECSKIAGGIPTLENDDVIIPGLELKGFSQEDARNYSIVGCVEPVGTGCEWSACGNTGLESFWCMIGCIPLAINNGANPVTGSTAGVHCGYLYEMNNFEQFKDAFEKQVHYFLDWHITFCNFYELMYSENFPCIAASTMMEGCMESGMDVTYGGAKYNSTGLTTLGISNVADSLMAIKQLCFDTKRYTTQEMFDALAANWEGYEEMQRIIINKVLHYGNDIQEVDELAAWAMGLFADHMNEAKGPRGQYRGGTFTMTTHIPYGEITGATPDGRGKGDPLAEAISPRQGFDKTGPTAVINSVSKLPHINLLNGDQLNMKFSPHLVKGDEGTSRMRDLF